MLLSEFDVSPNDTTVDINDMNVELNCQPSVSATGFMDFSIWEIFLDNGTFWTVTGSDLDRQLDRLVHVCGTCSLAVS